VAAPIGFRFSREGMGVRLIGGALLAGFCTYVVTALAQALGNNGVLPALLATGLPASIAAICGVTWLVAEERMLHLPRRV
jgi:lipopolysaccharide export LptBFGC system permease protein LptF